MISTTCLENPTGLADTEVLAIDVMVAISEAGARNEVVSVPSTVERPELPPTTWDPRASTG